MTDPYAPPEDIRVGSNLDVSELSIADIDRMIQSLIQKNEEKQRQEERRQEKMERERELRIRIQEEERERRRLEEEDMMRRQREEDEERKRSRERRDAGEEERRMVEERERREAMAREEELMLENDREEERQREIRNDEYERKVMEETAAMRAQERANTERLEQLEMDEIEKYDEMTGQQQGLLPLPSPSGNVFSDSNDYFHTFDVTSSMKVPPHVPDRLLNQYEMINIIEQMFKDNNIQKNQQNKKVFTDYKKHDTNKDNYFNQSEFSNFFNHFNNNYVTQTTTTPNRSIEPFVEGGYGGNYKEKEEGIIEPFSSGDNCCPQGFDMINGNCERVCINCKYNNCNKHSQNIGQVYGYENNKKGISNKKNNEDVLEYIFSELDN